MACDIAENLRLLHVVRAKITVLLFAEIGKIYIHQLVADSVQAVNCCLDETGNKLM